MKAFTRIAHASVLAVWLSAGFTLAQSLTITSPKEGAVVRTGETITVIVEAKPEYAFQGVVIVSPLGFSQILSKPPYRFTFEIPAGARPREYGLTADGYTTPGHGTYSKLVTIAVERADRPTRINVKNSPVVIPVVGGQEMLGDITGMFGHGDEVDLTESTHLQYSTDNPKVATVDARGVVTGVRSGAAKITVGYNGSSIVVPVKVEQRPGTMVVR